MSALGQKRTSFLLDDFIGEAKQSGRHFNTERPGDFGIDRHVKFRRLHNWQIPAATRFAVSVALGEEKGGC